MKIRIDSAVCQGHTLCAMNAPELVALRDEDGHATVRAVDVPPEQEQFAIAAARSCPEQAIRLS